MSQNESSLERDLLVRELAEMLGRDGYVVSTCLAEEEHQPPPLDGCTPDVYALKRGSPSVIGAIALAEALRNDAARQRWQELFAAATRPGSHPGYELHIIVPSSCLDEASQKATEWGVEATFHIGSSPTNRDSEDVTQ